MPKKPYNKKCLENLNPSNNKGKKLVTKGETERAYFMWLSGKSVEEIREVWKVHDITFRKYMLIFAERAKQDFLEAGILATNVDEEDVARKDRILSTLRKEIDTILNELEKWDEIEGAFAGLMNDIKTLAAKSGEKIDRVTLMSMAKSVGVYTGLRKARQDLRAQLQSLIKTWKENSRVELAEMTEKESAKTMAKNFANGQAEALMGDNVKKDRATPDDIKSLGGGLFDDN